MKNNYPNTPEDIKRIKSELQNNLAQLKKVKEDRMESLFTNSFSANNLHDVQNSEQNTQLIANKVANTKRELSEEKISKVIDKKRRKKSSLNYIVYAISVFLLSFVIYQYFDFTKAKNDFEKKEMAEVIKDLSHNNYLDSIDLINAKIQYQKIQNKIAKDSTEIVIDEQFIAKD